MSQDRFDGLSVFLAVAGQRSFTAAAATLGVTPTAVSQAVKALERRLGMPLFQRTTRKVALTEAGSALFRRLAPAAEEIGAAFEDLGRYRDRPVGTLRITVPRIAVPLVIAPLLPRFRQAFPEVSVEIAVEDAAVDITARGFDAGIRIGEAVEKDMVAVRLTPDFACAVVGAPRYFAARGRPLVPEDLTRHEAIRFRYPTSGVIYRWEFVREGRDFSVEVPGGLIANDSELVIDMAVAGLGLAYLPDLVAERYVEAGQLEQVLAPYLPRAPGFFLYFAARSQMQPKLRAFIDMAVAARRQA
jgi:DNA-binding transcriptional LysR family regulator